MAKDKQLITTTPADLVTLEQLEAVKNIIAKDATNEELQLFVMYCNQTKLNPLANQIHFVKRGGKPTFQTSIDGLRIVAERSDKYEGQTQVELGPLVERTLYYTGANKEKTPLKKSVPEWARIGVYKKGFKEPLHVTAYWDEYCPSYPNQTMWMKMPRVMLAKVAEALALRKAFPNDLAGVYTNDEMQQAEDKPERVQAEVVEPPKAPEVTKQSDKIVVEETMDTKSKEYFDLLEKVRTAKTVEDLTAIYNNNAKYQRDETFKKTLTNRKEQLVNTNAKPVEDILGADK
jgi:phage recombination protein Bet